MMVYQTFQHSEHNIYDWFCKNLMIVRQTFQVVDGNLTGRGMITSQLSGKIDNVQSTKLNYKQQDT